MGLLDSLFDQGSYGGQGGGLLDLLRQTQMQQSQYQPSMGFGGAASDPSQAQYPGQTGSMAVGNYQMPQIGSGFAPQGTPTDVSAAARQPMQQPAPAAQPDAGPGFGDRLMAGFQGFANSGGPLQALANGVSGLATGQRSDPAGVQQQSQRAIYEAVLQQPGMTKQKAFIIATNPKAFEAYSAQLFDNNKYAFQTLPDGTIVRQDPRTGEVAPAYQGVPKADFGVINEQDGQKTYGWVDKNKRTVTPLAGAIPDRADSITGPDGKQIAIPPGVDRKTFVNEVSRAGAKAAAGEKTEVQAKSEKFGNKMENAERNLKSVEGEGTGYMGRMLEGAPLIGGTAVTNWAQSEGYQKYKQARDNFITALLRDESGAAIGTSEFQRYEKELFPQPGDSSGVIAQKSEARKIAIEAMKKSAGPGYKSPNFEEASTHSTGGNKTKSGVSWGVIQ